MTDPASPASVTNTVASAEVRHVIVRACTTCGTARQIDTACAGCGNPKPPEVHDLGVVTAIYRNPVRRAVWRLLRKPLAERRIRRANVRVNHLRAHEE